MADMSYVQDEVSRVDTGAMREAAATARERLKVIDASTSELKSCLGRMQTVWDSAAEKEYEAAITKALAKVVASSLVYADLVSDLDQCAEEYERAHGQAKSIAETIETAVWADPQR